MSPGRGTARRTIRVPDALWEAAQAEAERRGEDVSEAIRRFLVTYVADGSEGRE